MTSLVASRLPQPSQPLPLSQSRARGHPRVAAVVAAIGIAAVAIGLRLWGLGATFASSDQVALPWMVRHQYGIKWLFAHSYGLVPAVAMRTWAELLKHLHVPMTEAVLRLPFATASILQVFVMFAMLRRMRCSMRTAVIGAAVCAVLPVLVTDAHYAWGYYACWLLAGSVAMWATLAYFDDGRRRWLVLAGAALVAHCLSNCFSFGLPVTLMWAWWTQRGSRGQAEECLPLPSGGIEPTRRRGGAETRRSVAFLIGFVLPCLMAMTIILGSWLWTGEGQIGRLLFKRQSGCAGLQVQQLLGLPGLFVNLFGYAFAIFAAAGLCWGVRLGDRRRLLAIWGWASLLPLTLLTDWGQVGYAVSYFNEVSLVAGCLGALLIVSTYRLLASASTLRVMLVIASTLAFAHMTLASVDAALGDGAHASWTGVRTGWGSVKPESGIKAAGWYVRRHVPADAIVMATHTNTGLEVSVAEYYLGRRVLADCDVPVSSVEPLIRQMAPRIDVLIIEPTDCATADSLVGFERAATFRDGSRAVRCVYARTGLHLPRLDAQAGELGTQYDRQYQTWRVPQPLTAGTRFDACLEEYKKLLSDLRNPRE
jgi:hypothetical protein